MVFYPAREQWANIALSLYGYTAQVYTDMNGVVQHTITDVYGFFYSTECPIAFRGAVQVLIQAWA